MSKQKEPVVEPVLPVTALTTTSPGGAMTTEEDDDLLEILGAMGRSQAANINTYKLFPQIGIQHQNSVPLFELPDKTAASPLNVVIVNATSVRSMFEIDVPVPTCTSIGGTFSTNGTACKTCPNFAWASGANGVGRACKESRKLLLYIEGREGVAELNIPITSIAEFDRYAAQVILSGGGKPLVCYRTELSLVPKSEKSRKWACVNFTKKGLSFETLPAAEARELRGLLKSYQHCYAPTPAPAGYVAHEIVTTTKTPSPTDSDTSADDALNEAMDLPKDQATRTKLSKMFSTPD